jgi:putative endonuclease
MTELTETTAGAPTANPAMASAGTTHHQALGDYGERLAERHLTEAGMRLLDRNWRCPDGEADLVLREGDVLVVCEVKTRTSLDYGSPQEAVTDEKLERLGRIAQAWVTAHEVHPSGVRIDMVAVLRPRKGRSVIEHVRGLSR